MVVGNKAKCRYGNFARLGISPEVIVYLSLRFLPRVVCDRALLPLDLLPLFEVLLLPADVWLRFEVLLAVFLLPLMLWLRELGFFLRAAVVFDLDVLDPALRAPLRSSIALI
jgi:hypothetical protein